MDDYIGNIRLFGFNFAPRNYVLCDGRLMSISQNTALYSILGTTYGGDGQTTFGVPDLRGRAPVHAQQGPGLSAYPLGQRGGAEQVTLSVTNLPAHTHTINGATGGTLSAAPSTGAALSTSTPGAVYDTSLTSPVAMAQSTSSGSTQPHNNRQPYLGLNYCLCVYGLFPSRN